MNQCLVNQNQLNQRRNRSMSQKRSRLNHDGCIGQLHPPDSWISRLGAPRRQTLQLRGGQFLDSQKGQRGSVWWISTRQILGATQDPVRAETDSACKLFGASSRVWMRVLCF